MSLLMIICFFILRLQFLSSSFVILCVSPNSSISKNPAKPNKHIKKNLKSGIVELFPPYFVNKVLLISDVLCSFLVVSVLHNRWHPSKANWTEILSVGELNPHYMMIPSYSVKCSDYWTFSAGYEESVIKEYCYVKWICEARNHTLFTVTPI